MGTGLAEVHMKTVLLVLVAGIVLFPTAAQARLDVPMDLSHKATAQDYRSLGKALKRVRESIQGLKTAIAGWPPECQELSPEKTVRCAAAKFDPPGGVTEALAVWQCESNFGIEPPHTDSYHGPFQFAYLTYESQQESMPDIVQWNELSPAVHDVRSNIMTAIAWASRHGWGPWSCA